MTYTVSWLCDEFDGCGSEKQQLRESFQTHADAIARYNELVDNCHQSGLCDDGLPWSVDLTHIKLTTDQ